MKRRFGGVDSAVGVMVGEARRRRDAQYAVGVSLPQLPRWAVGAREYNEHGEAVVRSDREQRELGKRFGMVMR